MFCQYKKYYIINNITSQLNQKRKKENVEEVFQVFSILYF